MLRSPTVAWSPGVRRILLRSKTCLHTAALKKSSGPAIKPDSGESPRFDPWLLALRNDAYWASPDSLLSSLRALFAPPGVKRCITGSTLRLHFVQVLEPDTDPRCFGPSAKSRASEELANIADCNLQRAPWDHNAMKIGVSLRAVWITISALGLRNLNLN